MHRATLSARTVALAHRAKRLPSTYYLPSLTSPANASRLRCCSTESSEPPNYARELDMLADPENKLVRDVYCSADGNELFAIDAQADLSNMDWAAFEAAFGLDSTTDEEVDAGWQSLQEKYDATITTQNDHTNLPVMKGRSPTHSSHACPDSAKPVSPKFYPPPLSSPAFVPPSHFKGEVPFFQQQHCISDKADAQSERPRSQSSIKTLRPSLSLALDNADVTRKPDTTQKSDTTCKPDPFRQPVNMKRPGFERRVMSMEREMEKIVLDVLCGRRCEWYTEGADVERVLLSPNTKNLTVFYNLDHPGKPRPAGWWRRTHSKFASAVRSALANRLGTRYVPTVHFEQANGSKTSQSPATSVAQLDLLFDQIEAERDGNITKQAGEKEECIDSASRG